MNGAGTQLIEPYGGSLVDLRVDAEELRELMAYAGHLPSIQITDRTLCDLELLAIGAFSPLDRFMSRADYQRVLDESRLSNGMVFPMPITLSVDAGPDIRIGQQIALRDAKNNLLAIMTIQEVYEWDLAEAAAKVFGTEDVRHPAVAEMHRWGKVNISGRLQVLQLPPRHDFQSLRLSPAETRAKLQEFGRHNVVAFQTRNPMHRVHEELTKRAIDELDAVLLLHPVVGLTKPGDVDYYTRVRSYRALTEHYYDSDRGAVGLATAGHAHGGTARSTLARDYPAQLWQQSSDYRA